MADIEVEQAHGLGRKGARQAVEEVAHKLQEQIGGNFYWEGDLLHFTSRGAQGRIRVEPAHVRVEIELKRMLKPMKGRVRAAVASYLVQELRA